MLQIRKRDKSLAGFDIGRIKNAVQQAFEATEKVFTPEILDILALRATSKFQSFVKDNIVDIENVQDSVEVALEESGYGDVAKAYILYRKQREKLRNMNATLLDYKNLVNNYVKSEDWRVKENSTVTYSVGGLILHNSGAVTANYWLSEVYDEEIATAHKNGDFHIHDLSMLTAYCAGWSLKQLIELGLGGVTGKITSAPAAHLTTIVNQMVNFLGIMQNEWAGAQAFSSFDTYLAPFVRIDNLKYEDVKQSIQSFVFGVNIPSRWGTQAPFSNITLDWTCPEDLKNEPAITGGKEQEFTYGDCQKEMDMINRAFLELMIDGDAAGRGFQYPIPTYNITKDFKWDTENAQLLFEMTAKYGTPYFQNFVNSDMEPGDVRSMCCRLQLDKRELKKKTGGLFGSGEKTGSIGVVTVNLPRIAYTCENEKEFYSRLGRLMDVAKRSLETKRVVTARLMEHDFYPYTKRYLGNFDAHFSTIGLIGMNEMCQNARWIRDAIGGKKGKVFSEQVLDFMRERLMTYQEETGNLYNLEATPAESATYRLAKMDVARFKDIVTAAGDEAEPFYTNSCHLPVDFTEDPFEALEIQDALQTRFTGGTVFHTFLGEKVNDWKTTAKLVNKIADSYHIPYFTITPTYSICTSCGYIPGEHENCPDCGRPAEIYSRITGYYRPVKHWNKGKSSEYEKRKTYTLENEVGSGEKSRETVDAEIPVSASSGAISVSSSSDEYRKIETGCMNPEIQAESVHDGIFVKNPLYDKNEENHKKVEKKLMLFTTKTCPSCPKAKDLIFSVHRDVKVIDAEENINLSRKYGVRSVPTLVVKDTTGNSMKNFTGLSGIRRFSENPGF
ncbi:MAG: ribonucleoside triphosphate reductase [bacterium]